ncbi:hypothetical protein BT63DRAFT_449857 [Microthyrium microscopicum]|uniref:Uncharacterized protein n=1 Tax=Microthyrium microscopicum TaxID=703497 RepID=A0A6A6UUX1_9PEZI|nr:hypothetical protein BT63DRAFT_449857 [Microthyrium microscopicum]
MREERLPTNAAGEEPTTNEIMSRFNIQVVNPRLMAGNMPPTTLLQTLNGPFGGDLAGAATVQEITQARESIEELLASVNEQLDSLQQPGSDLVADAVPVVRDDLQNLENEPITSRRYLKRILEEVDLAKELMTDGSLNLTSRLLTAESILSAAEDAILGPWSIYHEAIMSRLPRE